MLIYSVMINKISTLKKKVTDQQVEETKAALRGLGLDDDVKMS
jgi:hypothetical protein